jgi:tRNA(fMet)-specific endonuclease VapC
LTLYMLDTNVISDLIRNPKGRVAKRIARVGDDGIYTSIVVAAELRYGCAKSGSRNAQGRGRYPQGDQRSCAGGSAVYGRIRAELEAAGKPIGSNDFLIAAHAYATDATIVTANSDVFKRVRGLKVENWLS